MESVSDFALRGFGYGYGEGSGTDYVGERGGFFSFEYSTCDGSGSGEGSGYGHDDCGGHGDGDGSGYGYYNETVHSYTCESGGFGYGDFVNLKSYNGKRVYDIDSVATLILSLHGNLAKCKTINNDLTLSDCYVAKNGNLFAHGETAQEAISALREKVIGHMDVDEKIDEFLSTFERGKKYPTIDFYRWHNLLTGSCEYGRKKFAAEHGVDLGGEMTVDEFIALTEDAYGGNVIKKLKERYAE